MKAQFFIISSVIMIYVIILTFQYLTGFSDIRLTQVEEQHELSYIQSIKDSLIQTINASNYSSDSDCYKIEADLNATEKSLKEEMIKKGINLITNHEISCTPLDIYLNFSLETPKLYTLTEFNYP